MKLLYDHNLSPSLVDWLDDLYPESAHAAALGLQRLSDDAVWRYAGDHGYTLVTIDTDFDELSLMQAARPKTVRVRGDRLTTRLLVDILRRHFADIQALDADDTLGLLVLS